MSVGVWPVFNPALKSLSPDLDGGPLLDSIPALDELCESLGVPLVSGFGDTRLVPEDFEGDPDELDDVMGPWTDWFSVSDGLKMTDALLGALGKPETNIELEHDRSVVVAELEEVARCLRAAARAEVKWRLEVVK